MTSPRDAIMKAAAIPTVEGKLLGVAVRFRGLTAGEQVRIFDGRPIRELLIPVCAACIVDDDGKPIFSEDDIAGLKAGAFHKPFGKILELTGLGEEEAEKNS